MESESLKNLKFKITKTEFFYFFSNSDFKNQFFGTILFENLKILSFLFVWILKEPISTKKTKFLKILHPYAKPLSRADTVCPWSVLILQKR
jgi:ABC-type multidrug transport system permease subunit